LSFSKIVLVLSVVVLTVLGLIFAFKKGDKKQETALPPPKIEEIALKIAEVKDVPKVDNTSTESASLLPEGNLIDKLFSLDSSKLPIVETVTYTSRVPWLKGRPAWISDYASHYETSKHFIARSLNRKADYFTQKVHPGDRFNVLKKELSFYLVVDLSRSKLWFYAVNDNKEKTLLKTYSVGLGRKDSSKTSGYLTPIGKFTLGKNITVYSPGVTGYFRNQKIEMIRVFGTRWIPFDQETEGCTESAKGLGIHGLPWIEDSKTQNLVEDRSLIGKYESDGCIRMNSEDVEEIYAITATKPTTIELVSEFHLAKLPGKNASETALKDDVVEGKNKN
jgi:hypothetical protein